MLGLSTHRELFSFDVFDIVFIFFGVFGVSIIYISRKNMVYWHVQDWVFAAPIRRALGN